MLGNTKGRLLNKYVPDYVLYDLETTGISCNYDEVIEISAIRVRNGSVDEEFSSLVNPGRPIPYAASSVNHITDDMVAGSPDFVEVLQKFLDFTGDDVLVGHNINGFDMKFLYRDCERFFGQMLANDYVDTLKLSRICIPGLSHYRLGDLAEYYGFSTEGAHRALNDCRMNQQIYEELGKVLRNAGKPYAMRERAGTGARMTGNEGVVLNGEGIKICPVCGQIMKKRNGRYGEFWGCTGFPLCRHTEKI